MRSRLAALAVATLGGLALLTSGAGAVVLPDIPVTETIRAPEGSTHLISTTPIDAALDGGSCDVTVTGENNRSVHPGSDILVASANEVVVADVERAAGVETIPADSTLLLGTSVTVTVRIGSDGVFSGGLLSVSLDCEPPPPPPPPSTTVTSTPPPSTVTTATTAPPACEDDPATENDECSTLPRTGSSSSGPIIFGAVVAGAGTLALLVSRKRPRRA